jgi:hypothetical protein
MQKAATQNEMQYQSIELPIGVEVAQAYNKYKLAQCIYVE